MARTDVPIFSPNWGSTRMIAGPPDSLARRRSVPAVSGPSAATPDLVGQAVVQRDVGGVDDVGRDTARRPDLAILILVGAFDHHPRHRLGRVLRRQYPHLVVG